jgi:nucleotide-binding universal stress UspA family protein
VYEKILAAIDASEIGERVLAAAEELATLGDGEVHVLHLWESEPSRSMACTAPTWEDAQMVVKAATEQLAEAGIKASGEVAANLHSRWAFEITRCANSHDASVIVIGSRRRSDLSSLLAGSTAHKVVHAADCPVVVVP